MAAARGRHGRGMSMTAYILIAVGAGIVSVLSLLALSFGLFEGMVFAYLTPLPLFLVGLSLGAPAAIIAGGVGTLLTSSMGTLMGGPSSVPLGLCYLIAFAAPTVLLCRQSLLWRNDAKGQPVWYPPRRSSARPASCPWRSAFPPC